MSEPSTPKGLQPPRRLLPIQHESTYGPNKESAVHPMYAYIYVADKYEGLVLVNAATLLDGNPLNNYLERAVTYNPGGFLNGANSISFVGTLAYVCCDAGLVVVDLDDPTCPNVRSVCKEVHHPHSVATQLRYAFVTDEEGVTVLDISDPIAPQLVSRIHLEECAQHLSARERMPTWPPGNRGWLSWTSPALSHLSWISSTTRTEKSTMFTTSSWESPMSACLPTSPMAKMDFACSS